MIKTMDNNALKSMMQMQGMSITDEQISMMKNVDPQMMKTMMNNTGGLPNMPMKANTVPNYDTNNKNESNNLTPSSNNNTDTINSSHSTTQSSSLPQMKGFPDLKNMDFNSMMKFVQDNPQILNMMGPQFSQMFGQNNTGGVNNEVMMNSVQTIFWLISLPQKIKAFFTSTKGILLSCLIIYLLYSYLYR